MHTFTLMIQFNYSVFECFEHPSVHPLKDLYMQLYVISVKLKL